MSKDQAWWYIFVILAVWEGEVGGKQWETGLGKK
jgi:hypothetical protein